MAAVATVLTLLPASVSAHGSEKAARASGEAAAASKEAAKATKRSANAAEKSARAVTNTSIAQGFMDETGRYSGPKEHLSRESRTRNRSAASKRGRSERRI